MRPGQASRDPGSQVGDLRVGELALAWGHLEIRIGVSNRLYQQTILWIPRNNRGRIASEQHIGSRVQPQTGLEFIALRAVTGIALFNQHRADAVFEELRVLLRGKLRCKFLTGEAQRRYSSQEHCDQEPVHAFT